MGQPKHPLYWIYSGLILLLIPAIIVLIGLYEKSLSPESPLPPIPSKEVVLHHLATFDSTASVLHNLGVNLVVYALTREGSLARQLVDAD